MLNPDTRHVVITGGEPLLQISAIRDLLFLCPLKNNGPIWHLETNGTIELDDELINRFYCIVISPKLYLKDRDKHFKYAASMIRHNNIYAKIVVTSKEEVATVRKLFPKNLLHKVYVMPMGMACDDIIRSSREIAEAAIHWGLNFSTRLHTLVWNGAKLR